MCVVTRVAISFWGGYHLVEINAENRNALHRNTLLKSILIYCLYLLTIDECFDDIHECDSRAECQNTPGNYSCQCPDGYTSQWKDCIGKGKRNRVVNDTQVESVLKQIHRETGFLISVNLLTQLQSSFSIHSSKPKKFACSKFNFSSNLKVFSGIYHLLDLELKFPQTDQCETVTVFHHHGNYYPRESPVKM